MSTRGFILAVTTLITIWLLFDWSGTPELVDVYEKNSVTKVAAAKGNRNVRADSPRLPAFEHNEDFFQWQSKTRASYINALGLSSSRPTDATSVNTLRKISPKRGVIREYFELIARDGLAIPGVIQYPVGAKELPGIVVIAGHTPNGESGLSQLIDEQDSYQHAAATELAAAGFATIAIELRGFGLLGAPHYPDHKIVAYNELQKGKTYKGLVLSDLHEVLGYLQNLEMVDGTRLGVAGASLGGELSVALGVSSPQIKAIAFSAYAESGAFADFGARIKKQPHNCHLIPGLAKFMRREDIFRLLAPRATLGVRDTPSKAKYSGFAEDIASAWRHYAAQEQFEFVLVEDGVHEFFVEQTVEFFKQNL